MTVVTHFYSSLSFLCTHMHKFALAIATPPSEVAFFSFAPTPQLKNDKRHKKTFLLIY